MPGGEPMCPHTEGCCPATNDWCTRQCSMLCDRIGEGVEPEPGTSIDCSGMITPAEREALFGMDPAVWPDVAPDPFDLGETVPWPMGTEQ